MKSKDTQFHWLAPLVSQIWLVRRTEAESISGLSVGGAICLPRRGPSAATYLLVSFYPSFPDELHSLWQLGHPLVLGDGVLEGSGHVAGGPADDEGAVKGAGQLRNLVHAGGQPHVTQRHSDLQLEGCGIPAQTATIGTVQVLLHTSLGIIHTICK